MCLQRRFPQEVSSSAACIAPRILDFSQSLAFSGANVLRFSPVTPRIVGFSQELPSSDSKFPLLFHVFDPTTPKTLGVPLLMQHVLHSS